METPLQIQIYLYLPNSEDGDNYQANTNRGGQRNNKNFESDCEELR